MQIISIHLSPGHNYFGHHEKPAGMNEIISVDSVECVAGSGLRGDRFFDHKKNYQGQITFFSWEVYKMLCSSLNVYDKSSDVFRRNIVTRDIDLNTLIGKKFELQSIQFEGVTECSPCHWMDQAFAPGAEKQLKGQGGIRARILSNGILKTGSSEFKIFP